MKKRMLLYLILASCLLLSSCFREERYSAMGFSKSEYTIVEEEDTHGGFLGDGYYYLILDCSANAEKARSIVEDWTPLPLSLNLELMMYGGDFGGVSYGSYLAEETHWPRVEHGVYKFYDRFDGAVDRSDDSELFHRASYNFSIAMYDLDNDMLYYCRFDT